MRRSESNLLSGADGEKVDGGEAGGINVDDPEQVSEDDAPLEADVDGLGSDAAEEAGLVAVVVAGEPHGYFSAAKDFALKGTEWDEDDGPATVATGC